MHSATLTQFKYFTNLHNLLTALCLSSHILSLPYMQEHACPGQVEQRSTSLAINSSEQAVRFSMQLIACCLVHLGTENIAIKRCYCFFRHYLLLSDKVLVTLTAVYRFESNRSSDHETVVLIFVILHIDRNIFSIIISDEILHFLFTLHHISDTKQN